MHLEPSTFWMIVLAGLGTFLIRWLPMRDRRKGGQPAAHAWPPRWRAALEGVGPAAIMALLVVSLAGLLGGSPGQAQWMPVAAGLAGVMAGRRWPGGIAAATLCGTLAYGACLAALG